MCPGKNEPLKKIIKFWLSQIFLCLLLVSLFFVWRGWNASMEEGIRSEARNFLGEMAKGCEVFFKEDGNTDKCVFENLFVDNGKYNPPASCSPIDYFWYSVKDLGNSTVCFTATRCTQGGKIPQVKKPYHIGLTQDYKCGANSECRNWSQDYGK
jgi:hypothetical protein